MKAWIYNWFKAPNYPGDEEKNRRTRLLNTVLISFLVYMSIAMVGNWIGGITPTAVALIDIGMMFLVILMLRLVHHGKIMLVSIVMVVVGYLFITIVCLSLGTIRTPSTSGYLLLVVVAGALFERKGIFFFTIANSLAILGITLAENAGILPQPDYTVTISQWITYTGLLGFTGGLSFHHYNTLRKALSRAEKEIKVRQQVEDELRKLSRAVEQSTTSIVITDLAGNIEYVNPYFTRLTGYRLDEINGKNPKILKTDLTPPETHKELWQTIRAGREWRGEFVNKKKDGSHYYESASISPITDINGHATHFLAVKEDITERKRMELTLQESEQRFRTLIENAPVAIALSQEQKLIYANSAFLKMFGYRSADEIRDQLVYQHVTPEERDKVIQYFKRHEQQLQIGQELEMACLRKDGSQFYAQAAAAILNLANGPAYFGVVQDITERKQAEEKIRQLNTQLENRVIERTAELAQAKHLLEEKVAQLEKYHENLSYLFTKYRVVADNTYDWEYWLDTDDRFVYSSPSCKRISGYDAEQFLQDSSLLWRLVHPDDLSSWWQHKSAVDAGKNVEKITVRFICADGSIRWIGHVCQSVYDKSGQYLGNRGSNRDITEQKLAEDALNRQVERSQTLARITSKLNTSLELQEIMDMVCEELAKMLDAPLVMVWLVDEQSTLLRMRAAFGLTPEIFEQVVPLPNQFSRSREEKYKNIYYGRDIQLDINDPNFKITKVLGVHTILNSWFFDQDKAIGLLSVLRYEIGWEYSDTDYSMLDTIRNQVAITIHKAQLYEQVKAARTRLVLMSEKLIEVQEAERRSLALELHDQLGQMLSSTKLSLDIIPSLSTDKAADQLQRASDLIGDLIARVRRMALDLRPSMLDDMGLFPTLRWFFRSYQQQTGETVTFDHSGLDRRFQPQVEITAFRIVQEALTNVIRHADNKQVVVKAWADETSLNLQIRDFGTGFDPQISLNMNESSGLSGMRERARLLGGELIIESQPGSGTNLTARLPLAIQYEHT